jgi:hypothetical protein
MQRTSFASLAIVITLLIAGCTSDTPTEAASNSDDSVVSLVAASVGYESNGFASMLEDAVSVATGKRVAASDRQGPDSAVAVGTTNNGDISLVRRDHHNDHSSEWRSEYRLRPADSESVVVDAYCDGVFRNPAATLQGMATGDFTIERPSDSSVQLVRVSGSYAYNGSAIFHNGREYSSVRMTFNWNRLSVSLPDANGEYEITGQVDVGINAQSLEGTVSKNVRLIFNGTRHATVIAGGRQHPLNM